MFIIKSTQPGFNVRGVRELKASRHGRWVQDRYGGELTASLTPRPFRYNLGMNLKAFILCLHVDPHVFILSEQNTILDDQIDPVSESYSPL